MRKRLGNGSTHSPDAKRASKELTNDLLKSLCSIPGYNVKLNLKFVKLDDGEGPAAPPGGRTPPGGRKLARWTWSALQALPDHAVISFLGAGLHAGETFPRGVRSLLALREAVRDESWTWSALAHHVNKQHAFVSARYVVAGDAPPWTGALGRQLGARHAYAVGRPHRGVVPAPFRICTITEPNLPAAGHCLNAQHTGGVELSVPGTGRCVDDPRTFGALPGLLTYGTLTAKADSAHKIARGGPGVWGAAATALNPSTAVARVRSLVRRFEYAVIRPGPASRAPHERDRATVALVDAAARATRNVPAGRSCSKRNYSRPSLPGTRAKRRLSWALRSLTRWPPPSCAVSGSKGNMRRRTTIPCGVGAATWSTASPASVRHPRARMSAVSRLRRARPRQRLV